MTVCAVARLARLCRLFGEYNIVDVTVLKIFNLYSKNYYELLNCCYHF